MPCDLLTGAHACYAPNCPNAVKEGVGPEAGRWFISIGHPGFNSPANNRSGYSSATRARVETNRCRRMRSA
jgi:hypothetical protein